MNCINEDLIQKYIDGEASPNEEALIKEHITGCDSCGDKIDAQRKLAGEMKKTIKLLDDDSIEIPKFEKLIQKKNKKNTTLRRMFYAVAAASVLIFVLLLTREDKTGIDEEIILVNNFESEIDANRTISQQIMIINIIDSEGNISEYHY